VFYLNTFTCRFPQTRMWTVKVRTLLYKITVSDSYPSRRLTTDWRCARNVAHSRTHVQTCFSCSCCVSRHPIRHGILQHVSSPRDTDAFMLIHASVHCNLHHETHVLIGYMYQRVQTPG
jgi:hypothetical protein